MCIEDIFGVDICIIIMTITLYINRYISNLYYTYYYIVTIRYYLYILCGTDITMLYLGKFITMFVMFFYFTRYEQYN